MTTGRCPECGKVAANLYVVGRRAHKCRRGAVVTEPASKKAKKDNAGSGSGSEAEVEAEFVEDL
jgi:phage FluMu protein Com